MFMNVLTNAMKYSPEEGKVKVTASSQDVYTEEQNPVIMLSVIVQDEGPGIDIED